MSPWHTTLKSSIYLDNKHLSCEASTTGRRHQELNLDHAVATLMQDDRADVVLISPTPHTVTSRGLSQNVQ